jgi:DNA-binding transcriptional ArsR family regulator
MEAVRWLRESGLKVEDRTAEAADAGVDAILDVAADGHVARFAVQVKGRAPYPHEVERLQRSRRELAKFGHPMMVAPFVSEPLGVILTRADWSWADDQGNFDLRVPGLLLRQRRKATRPVPKRGSLPRGSGSFAVIRALVRFRDGEDEELGATALAIQAGVSQPRVSQVLHHLRDLKLVDKSPDGYWKPRRQALIDRFLAEYPGPGGSEQYCYSLESPTAVAVRAGQVSEPWRPIVASADVGPDLIVPWRRPSLVILYTKHVIDPTDLNLVSAQGSHDANVIVRMPADRSVFPFHALVAQVQGNDVPLADPLQQIWDLQDLGGADRHEAAGRLREWLLRCSFGRLKDEFCPRGTTPEASGKIQPLAGRRHRRSPGRGYRGR